MGERRLGEQNLEINTNEVPETALPNPQVRVASVQSEFDRLYEEFLRAPLGKRNLQLEP